jgi:hypothetical protein
MEIFQPKNKEDILMMIAKRKSAKNRAFLIALSIYHEDIFDRFFTAYLGFTELDIYNFMLYLQKTGEKRAYVTMMSQAQAAVKMFHVLGFDASRFIITDGRHTSGEKGTWYEQPNIKISIPISDLPLINHYIEITEKHTIKRKKRKRSTKKKA